MENAELKVSALIDAIRGRDRNLGDELQAKRGQATESGYESFGGSARRFGYETIVLRTGRPVLAVSHDEAQLTFTDVESEVWRQRLKDARPLLIPAIRAVGRIELENHPRYAWVGTGWLVRPDVIVTNRHVAEIFGKAGGEGFVFRPGSNHLDLKASVDFLEEFGNSEQRLFRVARIMHIESEDGPDLAFLRVEGDGLADEIKLSITSSDGKPMVAAIGYPARDSRVPDQDLVNRIFGDIYDKKRLAPGQVIGSTQQELEHDCSTLGGNSGSVILDLQTGHALGIHFSGSFLESNYAVPAKLLEQRLDLALKGNSRTFGISSSQEGATATTLQPAVATPRITVHVSPYSTSFTLPLTITFEVATPLVPSAQSSIAAEDAWITEGVVEDYSGRQGYQKDFLGADKIVELAEVVRDADEIVEFQASGKKEHILHYEHYSVVMNRKRRMCFYSAVNIEGKLSRKATRTGWRIDPRIDKSLQIMHECYGSPPKFSRGHMTRREDPVWGTPAQALLGNSDSMHVTNTTPQMQNFNAPIWLGLEDFALQNARRDRMRISVFTGPILRDNDPVRFEVKIPRTFWKVIAFIHDDTGELAASGYTASQEDHLPEFVFGDYDTWQRPLAWIEKNAGISFGKLAAHDSLRRESEAPAAPLTGFEQIRLLSL